MLQETIERESLPVYQPGVVAQGAYTEITEIVAPASVPAGSLVAITVRIKNNYSSTVAIMVDGSLEYGVTPWPGINFPTDTANVDPGVTYSFSGNFIMPGVAVIIHAYSYYYSTDGSWPFDDEMTKSVDVDVVWQKLATKAVTVTPIVVAWQKLATATATITPIVVVWQKLATTSVTILPTTVGWEKLTTKAVTLTAKEFTIPPDFKKVLDKVYPDGETYNGPAERVIAEFKLTPEQIPGTRWFAETVMANKMASEVEAQGAKMLTLKVYENTVPTLWTEYILIAEATKPAVPARAVASPLAWTPIILAALVIVGVIVFYFFFLHPVLEFIYKAPGKALGSGLILLGAGALAVLGIAMSKGTSVKGAVTGSKGGVKA